MTQHPSPAESDIEFILEEVRSYLSPDIEVRRGDVLSAWSGIRPLVSDPNKPDSQSLVRTDSFSFISSFHFKIHHPCILRNWIISFSVLIVV